MHLEFGFIKKTYPLQKNEWIHRLLPILERSCAGLKQMPEHAGSTFTTRGITPGVLTDLIVDGTERPLQTSVQIMPFPSPHNLLFDLLSSSFGISIDPYFCYIVSSFTERWRL